MNSRTTQRFRKAFNGLPKEVQRQAKNAFQQFKKDPFYPSLRFKRVHSAKPVYSVRVNIDYRAVGIQEKNEMIWFWIGSHEDYEKLLPRL